MRFSPVFLWLSLLFISCGVHADLAPVTYAVSGPNMETPAAPEIRPVAALLIPAVPPVDAENTSPIEARLMVKIDDLKMQQLELMGKLELIENVLQKVHGHQKKVVQLVGLPSPVDPIPPEAVSTSAAGDATETPAATPSQPATPDETLLVELKHLQPEEAYEKARALIPRGEYALAEKGLNEFIRLHAKHPLVPAALYWVGETHFVRGDYAAAAKKFLAGYKVDPKGTKVPDFLLKLGMTLEKLGKTKEACSSYKKLFADFPHMNPSIKAVATRENARLQCKG